jgi:hypothetical protein
VGCVGDGGCFSGYGRDSLGMYSLLTDASGTWASDTVCEDMRQWIGVYASILMTCMFKLFQTHAHTNASFYIYLAM